MGTTETTRAGDRRRLAACLALGAAALGLTSGCSLLVNTKADQCEADADCKAFPGTSCVDRVCAGAPACATNQDCLTRFGDYTSCRKSSSQCVSLLTADCATVVGDYRNDDAFLLGSLLPTTGPETSLGLPMQDGLELALHDFETAAVGLPPAPGGTTHRPLVLVECSDQSDATTAVRAARHLAEDLGVPALVGPARSDLAVTVATTVTIPDQVLLVSPAATSVALTDLEDGALVWRTAPSDVYQAMALAQHVPHVEQAVRVSLGLGTADSIKVTVLHRGDAAGTGFAEALEGMLELNGHPALSGLNAGDYARIDYGDPDDPLGSDPPRYAKAVAATLASKPHVVLILGSSEGVKDVFEPLEAQWDGTPPSVGYRPRFLFSDGGRLPELWSHIGADGELRLRVTGSAPGTSNSLFLAFRSAFEAQFSDGASPDTFGAAGAYDIGYLLSYAAVALAGRPVSGPTLATFGLPQTAAPPTVPVGQRVSVGSDGINGALRSLLAGPIDFSGASGPLDFGLSRVASGHIGEAPSDVQLWCLATDSTGLASGAPSSGEYLDARTLRLTGAPGPQCD